jgi:hypothetical protein
MNPVFQNERLSVVLEKLNIKKPEIKHRVMRHTFNSKGIAGGIVDVLDNNTKREVGITDFDGNKLPKGHYIVINAIAGYAETTAATPKAATWAGTPNVVLSNSNLIVEQDRKIIETAMQHIFNANLGKGAMQDDFYQLADGNVILPEQEFKVSLQAPTGTADSADKFVLLAFDVFYIIDRGQVPA